MNNKTETYLTICNQRGLHARAAAAFVKCLADINADVTVEKDGQIADGSSILSLMMLAASQGSTVKISAVGPEASKAIQSLTNLINSRFGEDE